MTQTEKARKGVLSGALKKVARAEGVAPDKLAELVASGLVVIPFNPVHSPARPSGIGRGLQDQGQRQPRHVPRFSAPRRRIAEGQDQPRIRRRRPDGPEHGRRPEEDPQGHPGPDAHPAGDRPHLPGRGQGHRPRDVHRRHGRGGPLRGRRVAGPRGRRLHDRPQRPDPQGHRPAERAGPRRRRRLAGRRVPRRLDAPQREGEPLLRPVRPAARDRPAPRRHPQPGRRPAGPAPSSTRRTGPRSKSS